MADASPVNGQSDPNLTHLAVTPTTTRNRSTRLADIEPQRVVASAECHMPVFHANDIHSDHSLSRKPTNHLSPDGLSDIPRTALDTINGDNNSEYYEATEKDLIPYLSSDEGERSYGGFLGVSPTLPDGHGVLRTAIEGLDPAEYAQEASLPPPPTVVSDAGNQHFKGQNRINSNSNSSCRLSQKTLEDQLFDARHFAQRPHTENWRGFIPKGQLDGIITEESVFGELKACLSNQIGSEEIREYAKCVCRDKKSELPDGRTKLKSFKSIFALLVLFRKPAEIIDFLKEDVSDIDLPLVSHGGTHHIGRRNRMFKPGEEETTLLGCFFKWSRIESESFLNYQWMMISPFFKESQYNDVQHYELHENHILPWIASDEDDYFEQQGGFGTVFPVRIHKEHHNFRDLEACRRGFAIKQLLNSDPVQFNREVGILQKFVGRNSHPHIVSLLATYLHRGKYHMIFYRAQSDLLKYWKAVNPDPDFNLDTIRWMAKQCEGIAGGLV
ncbi:kinase-like domain-containing protein [Apiospora marii]|uniref:Kinase-like domain-containing protein n=1 Tax=Apiospora marii TaxID=335849 RepID=A0ABR1R5E2_9PEZI